MLVSAGKLLIWEGFQLKLFRVIEEGTYWVESRESSARYGQRRIVLLADHPDTLLGIETGLWYVKFKGMQ